MALGPSTLKANVFLRKGQGAWPTIALESCELSTSPDPSKRPFPHQTCRHVLNVSEVKEAERRIAEWWATPESREDGAVCPIAEVCTSLSSHRKTLCVPDHHYLSIKRWLSPEILYSPRMHRIRHVS